MNLDLQSLIDKLNPVCRRGLEKAAELCVSHTNYNVEVEHYVLAILDIPDTDLQLLLRYYEIRAEDIKKDLTRFIERFRRGNSRTPALSPHILRLLEQSWMLSSLHFNTPKIRSAAILLALVDHNDLRMVIFESSPTLKRIPREALKNDISEIIRHSKEDADSPPASRSETVSGDPLPRSQTPNLDQYTIDLTARARSGLIDPILGRDMEIRQLIDILTRRRQNNPILTGEAGVGKTAVVEGLARRIAKGDVPPPLKNVSLRLLDLALLQAGAGIKGEFEKRLKAVIDEVINSPLPIIVFIDEAHTLIGAGGPAGMGDAANLLKPALARGELRTIAATTWSEYKKYFEKDPALARRFQVVKVEEPDEASAVEMLRGLAPHLEAYHNVLILDEALQDAVRLSHRYITGRQLPDKAISVMDTACARVSIGQNATPPEIEDRSRQIDQLETELSLLYREQATGQDHGERIADLEKILTDVRIQKEKLEKQWEKEKELAGRIIDLQKGIAAEYSTARADKNPGDSHRKEAGELTALKSRLAEIQGKSPMVPTCVDSGTVARVISNWTGIPVGKMMTDEIGTVLELKEKLSERIIGQSHALEAICRRIKTYRAHLDDPGKPVGVFLLTGPSGIGKTETAIALADILYGGDRNLIVINMSEYQEAYTVSGLKGSPPGYVGHGKGGVLTEAVRQRPYSVVLLDEVEKAHPDVMELFYQVFDKGMMEDSEGQAADFRNTVILMTCNVGAATMLHVCCNGARPPEPDEIREMIRPELLEYFKPAFLGRLVIVPYYPLTEKVIAEIVRLKIQKIQERFQQHHRIHLSCARDMAVKIAARCTDADTGARNVDNILTHSLLPELSGELLRRMARGEQCEEIHVYFDPDGHFAYEFRTEDQIPYTRAIREFGSSLPRYFTDGLQAEDTEKERPRVPAPEQKPEPELPNPAFSDSGTGDDDTHGFRKKRKNWLDIFRK